MDIRILKNIDEKTMVQVGLFNVKEDHVRAVSLEANGPVWEDSCVEHAEGKLLQVRRLLCKAAFSELGTDRPASAGLPLP